MRTVTLAASLLALSTSLIAQGALSGPCFETNYGTNLGLSDDSIAPGQALGFTFNGPGTSSVTAIDVSSNGFVWLGSSFDSGCCNGDPIGFVTGMARIAPMWMDLNPSFAGAVWFNSFPASGSTPARAVITWAGVPEYWNTGSQTFQLQMYADGSFSMAYDGSCSNSFHTVLTGVTEGVSATGNFFDISTAAGTPYNSGSNPTIYEDQLSTFDLAGTAWAFIPNGGGGYLVLQKPGCVSKSTPFGRGCPKPMTTYELFDATNLVDLSNIAIEFLPNGAGGYVAYTTTGFYTGYTNAQTFGDDDSHGPFALPFTFPFGGSTTTAIDISSNGFIWLQSGNFNSRCCTGDPVQFVADPASICGLWMDLYPPGAAPGSGIFFDTVGTTEAHITWVNVPEYFNTGSNTFQITLRSDGSFRLAYGSVANVNHDCLVGITEGNVPDPGSIDWTSGFITTGNGGTPLKLSAQSGSRPALGSTFTMDVDQITLGSVFGVMVFGTTAFPTGIDLSSIGMPGCELYASLDVLMSFPLTGVPTPFALAIPSTPSLAGVLLEAQAATLTPGATPLGLLSSNGLELQLGQ